MSHTCIICNKPFNQATLANIRGPGTCAFGLGIDVKFTSHSCKDVNDLSTAQGSEVIHAILDTGASIEGAVSAAAFERCCEFVDGIPDLPKEQPKGKGGKLTFADGSAETDPTFQDGVLWIFPYKSKRSKPIRFPLARGLYVGEGKDAKNLVGMEVLRKLGAKVTLDTTCSMFSLWVSDEVLRCLDENQRSPIV